MSSVEKQRITADEGGWTLFRRLEPARESPVEEEAQWAETVWAWQKQER